MSKPSLSPPLHPAPDIPPERLTPMFAQYLEIKKQHEDALLFYRMGDFYELFFDDAVVAAKALQITLTSRNPQAEHPVPMCGVPHHSHASYVRQLREQGFKVAICEQMEDPKAAKGLVKREVVRIETPGATLDDEGLTAKDNNFLAALYWDAEKGQGGLAWLDYSTGDWSGIQTRRESDLAQWVRKMRPRELLVPDAPAHLAYAPKSLSLEEMLVLPLPARGYFDRRGAQERILECQGVRELGALGLENKDELVRACGALLAYLMRTQKNKLTHLRPFEPLRLSRHLIIDEITERNLEIFSRLDGKKGPGTLWNVIDESITPMGGRLLAERLRHPWREMERIRESADVVQFFYENSHKREALRKALDRVHDLERLSAKVDLDRANPKDMLALGKSLSALEAVREALEAPLPGRYPSQGDSAFPEALGSLYRSWDSMEDLAGLLETALADAPPPAITEGGLFKSGWHKELDGLIDLVEHGEQRMQELLLREQQSLALPKLKLGFNRVFGHYFELPKSLADKAPAYFIRRQTVANAERYFSPELKGLEDKLMSAGDKRKKLEYELFVELRRKLAAESPRIRFMAGALAALDFWQALAEAAQKRGWVRPELSESTDLSLTQARHPVVEAMRGSEGFVPNDLHMDGKRRLILITGPNMAGKSTVLRQTALIVILAQAGSFVPASKARIGLADRVFSRVGASDNLAQGQSTFMVEMMESARILRQATRKSLVILDEIGRGTSTFDGLSLAWAVAEDLTRRADGSIRTLFATHYHELTALEGRLAGLHNMNIAVTEHGGEIVFTRRLVPGPSDRSYGIEVAKLAGVPQNVVQRARSILGMLEKSRNLAREGSREAMQQLLPGMSAPEKAKTPAPLLPPPCREVSHPLFTILRDLDTNHLTPMQALALVTEWKQLWGDEDA